ncbi:MAG: pyruvate dehydrogenase (acetyl-transferring), homodimeric type, partial [Gammaproteobacteria bacterium]
RWDPLLARDDKGLLRRLMMECVDGEYQNFKAKGGAYTREHFFGKYPELKEMVANMSDDDIWRLNRGGHDARKVYNAYLAAVTHKDQPTVILAKTVKGYGMGRAGEGQNITHQQKKLDDEALKAFRDRFNIPVPDAAISEVAYYRPVEGSEELEYLHERRTALGGYLPSRRASAPPLTVPGLDVFGPLIAASGDREFSTTMALVRMLSILVKDKTIGAHIVPIVPDEARTFGMEGMFRQFGIYSSVGQLYQPVDKDQVSYYREDIQGQILEEGINEAGAYASWMAAATSYRNHGMYTIPFYIFYSMFGFQRIGDLAWASGDMRSRGFLLGGTAGRTTLAGEGLQHQDGHSHLLASTIPDSVSYDPAFAYELAVIIHDGMKRMYEQDRDIFYYITVMNENYTHPAMPENCSEGILRGMYKFRAGKKKKHRVQLLGSGTILREVIAAGELLEQDFNVSSDIWSVTSFNELRREGLDAQRWNLLHPDQPPRESYVAHCLKDTGCPVVAATDYMKIHADQIRAFVPGRYLVLGTDGFGRSDSRKQLRKFFEVDRYYVAVAALKALADTGSVPAKTVNDAIKKYGIDPEKPSPVTV